MATLSDRSEPRRCRGTAGATGPTSADFLRTDISPFFVCFLCVLNVLLRLIIPLDKTLGGGHVEKHTATRKIETNRKRKKKFFCFAFFPKLKNQPIGFCRLAIDFFFCFWLLLFVFSCVCAPNGFGSDDLLIHFGSLSRQRKRTARQPSAFFLSFLPFHSRCCFSQHGRPTDSVTSQKGGPSLTHPPRSVTAKRTIHSIKEIPPVFVCFFFFFF